jgi:hypothetical protein
LLVVEAGGLIAWEDEMVKAGLWTIRNCGRQVLQKAVWSCASLPWRKKKTRPKLDRVLKVFNIPVTAKKTGQPSAL